MELGPTELLLLSFCFLFCCIITCQLKSCKHTCLEDFDKLKSERKYLQCKSLPLWLYLHKSFTYIGRLLNVFLLSDFYEFFYKEIYVISLKTVVTGTQRQLVIETWRQWSQRPKDNSYENLEKFDHINLVTVVTKTWRKLVRGT